MPASADGARRTSRPIVVAHRGLSSLAPENTIAAFEQAYETGADFIEFDVHLSKDGVPVVIHDATLARTTDSDEDHAVHHLSVQELKQYDAGSWFGDEYAGEPLPTLERVLDHLAGKMGIFVEIKGQEGSEKELVTKTLEVVNRHSVTHESPIIVGSFSLEVLREVIAQAPDQPVLGNALDLESVRSMLHLGVRHIDLDHKIVTKEVVHKLREQGAIVWCFTVDDGDVAKQLFDWGVDGLITNEAHRFVASIDGRTL